MRKKWRNILLYRIPDKHPVYRAIIMNKNIAHPYNHAKWYFRVFFAKIRVFSGQGSRGLPDDGKPSCNNILSGP